MEHASHLAADIDSHLATEIEDQQLELDGVQEHLETQLKEWNEIAHSKLRALQNVWS